MNNNGTTTTLHLGPQWARQGGSLAQMMKESEEVAIPQKKTTTFIRPPVYGKDKMLSCHRDVGIPEGMNFIEGITTKECLRPVSLNVLTSEERKAFWTRRRTRGKSGEGQTLRKSSTSEGEDRWNSKESGGRWQGKESRERRPWKPSGGDDTLWDDAGSRQNASSSLEEMAAKTQQFEAMKAAARAKLKAEKAAREAQTATTTTTTTSPGVLFGDRSPVSPVVTELAPIPQENAWSSALNKHRQQEQQWNLPPQKVSKPKQQQSWTSDVSSSTAAATNSWGASQTQVQRQQQPLQQRTQQAQQRTWMNASQQQQQQQQQQQYVQQRRSPPTPTLVPVDMNTPQWWYRDPHGRTQGPFPGLKMIEWVRQGFFKRDLPVRFRDHMEFQPLGVLFPNERTMFTHVPSSIVSTNVTRRSPSLSPKLPPQQPTRVPLPAKATWGSGGNTSTNNTNADTRALMSALHIEPKQRQQQAALRAATAASAATTSAQDVLKKLQQQQQQQQARLLQQQQQQARLLQQQQQQQEARQRAQSEERKRAAMNAYRRAEELEKQQQKQKKTTTNVSPWGMKKQAKPKSLMEIQAEEEKREAALRKQRQSEAMELGRRMQGQTMAQRLGGNNSRDALTSWTTGTPVESTTAQVKMTKKKKVTSSAKPSKSLMEVQAEQLREQEERRRQQPQQSNAASWSNITSKQTSGWNRSATKRVAPKATKSLLEIQAEEARKSASRSRQNAGSRSAWLQAAGGSNSRPGTTTTMEEPSISKPSETSTSAADDSFWNGMLTEGGNDVKSKERSSNTGKGRHHHNQSHNNNTRHKNTSSSNQQQEARSSATTTSTTTTKAKPSEEFGSNMPRSMISWCKTQLLKITKSDDETLVRFCFTLDSPADIREYMRNYMGSTPQVSAFASEFIRRKNRCRGSKKNTQNSNHKSSRGGKNSTSRRGRRRNNHRK